MNPNAEFAKWVNASIGWEPVQFEDFRPGDVGQVTGPKEDGRVGNCFLCESLPFEKDGVMSMTVTMVKAP